MTTPISPQDLESVLQPVVEQAGLYLEEVKVQPSGKTYIVRVTVDALEIASGAVSLELIADASRAVSDALDGVRELADAYTLEVSSPGTNRPLTTPRHFGRAVGRLVKVVRHEGSDFTARLISVNSDVLTFEDEGQVQIGAIRKAKVEVELKRAEELKEDDFVEIESDGSAADSGVEE